MGFFSSRRADASPLPKSLAETKPITSKWYGKLRKKDSRAFQDANDTASVSSRRPLHPAPPSSAVPNVAPSDPSTLRLATRLNDLAASHADGLLDDEEYRILRQNIFERFGKDEPAESPGANGTNSTAREKRFSRAALPTFSHTSDPLASISNPKRPSLSHKSSALSSTTSITRHPTSRDSNESAAPQTPTSSAGSFFSGRSALKKYAAINSSSHTLQSQLASNTHLPRTNIPADTVSLSSRRSITHSVAPSHRIPPSAYAYVPPRNEPRQTLPDNDDEKTSAQLRRELAEVQLEGRRVLEGFDTLETGLLDQIDALTINLDVQKGESDPLGVPPKSILAIRTPSETTLSASATAKPRKRSSLMDFAQSALVPSALKSSPPPRPSQPPPQSVIRNVNARSPPSSFPVVYPEVRSPSSYTISSHDASPLDAVDPSLVASLADVRKRRADVQQRYDARVAFLRAKLRGAELHERLVR